MGRALLFVSVLLCSLLLASSSAAGSKRFEDENDVDEAGAEAIFAQEEGVDAEAIGDDLDVEIDSINPDNQLAPEGQSAASEFGEAFTQSLMMIFVTEIGDKTFFIAAIMSMKQGRTPVLIGALGALWVMTILSVAMGYELPQLISKQLTHIAATLLFLYFGLKLLYDASKMSGESHSDELDEVERQFETDTGNPDNDYGDNLFSDDIERPRTNTPKRTKALSWSAVVRSAFVLTFLAEWGDRSQISTIALSVSEDPWGVMLGGAIGHMICTGIAVQGGKMLASRISERTVSFVGGVLFLVFGIHEYFWG